MNTEQLYSSTDREAKGTVWRGSSVRYDLMRHLRSIDEDLCERRRALLCVEGFADPADHGADQRGPHRPHRHHQPQQGDHQAARRPCQQWVRNTRPPRGELLSRHILLHSSCSFPPASSLILPCHVSSHWPHPLFPVCQVLSTYPYSLPSRQSFVHLNPAPLLSLPSFFHLTPSPLPSPPSFVHLPISFFVLFIWLTVISSSPLCHALLHGNAMSHAFDLIPPSWPAKYIFHFHLIWSPLSQPAMFHPADLVPSS